MTVADVDAVMAIEVRAYSHPWSRGNFVDSVLAGHVAELVLSDQGALCAYFVAMPGVDELHLLNITVAPDWQGAGLGQRLLFTVCQRAAERALPTLWLEVRHSNLRARQLYGRLGFAEVGVRKGYYPAMPRREDAVVMRLEVRLEVPPPLTTTLTAPVDAPASAQIHAPLPPGTPQTSP